MIKVKHQKNCLLEAFNEGFIRNIRLTGNRLANAVVLLLNTSRNYILTHFHLVLNLAPSLVVSKGYDPFLMKA
jgi:hypothetical protein